MHRSQPRLGERNSREQHRIGHTRSALCGRRTIAAAPGSVKSVTYGLHAGIRQRIGKRIRVRALPDSIAPPREAGIQTTSDTSGC